MFCRALSFILILLSLQAGAAIPLAGLLPKPYKAVSQTGSFLLDATVVMITQHNTEQEINLMDRLSRDLYKEAGLTLARRGKTARSILINFDYDLPDTLGPEGYLLTINPDKIEIRANSEAGVFYGITSLVQLASGGVKGRAELECGQIIDKPRFSWRGAHLDVSRHFFTVDQVKTYLDWMALYKFNTFHWHLTDDQGWRIEIKKYPDLTRKGSTRAQTVEGHHKRQPLFYDGRPYGGYYTQEEVKDVVKYAQTKFITVVPEIDMPGHMQAAIAAYPKLGCTGDTNVKVWQTWGVSPNILNPSPETQAFMKDVLDEVSALFSGEFFHLGGDEAPKAQWKANAAIQAQKKSLNLKTDEELQGYFMSQMEAHLTSLGKRMVGWDENLMAGVKPTCLIMAWRGVTYGHDALKKGHQVVMCPTKASYFDTYQADPKVVQQPLAIGGLIPLKQVLEFNPIPETATEDEKKRVVGVQCNLWSEFIPDMTKLQYQAFPRWLAMAEVAWSSQEKKAYPDFKPRAIANMKRLKEKHGIKPGPVQE